MSDFRPNFKFVSQSDDLNHIYHATKLIHALRESVQRNWVLISFLVEAAEQEAAE